MYKKLITLSLISAFALSACGGGSDDNGTNQPNNQSKPTNQAQPSSNQADNQPATQTDTPTDTTQAVKSKLTVFKYTLDSDDNPVSIDTTTTYRSNTHDGDNFDTITINGKQITLDKTSSNPQARKTHRNLDADGSPDADYTVALGTSYANYGWYLDDSVNEIALFYQGIATNPSQMPQTGTATYKGYAISLDTKEMLDGARTDDYENAGQYYGISTLNADFANKKLTGELNDWQDKNGNPTSAKPTISIDASIKENTFQGKANTNGYTEGKFYGANAEEIAGAFRENGLHGVFGAKKQ
ncbi:MAG: transferrin-binding protein-like solute binding protein [Neisseriaceae bacterium]|nr:transferrin-binding protein-like solute binding protein [Neisseriaceae bacterium]